MYARKICLVIAVLFAVLMLNGCKKSRPAPSPTASPTTTQGQAVSAIEQTTCPVTGEKIDKNIFTVYKDKKVYFCMESCKAAFEKEPEKYIAKLPQFSK